MNKIDTTKRKLLEGKFIQSLRIIKHYKLQRFAKVPDKYIVLFCRTLWSHQIHIDSQKIVFLSFNKQYTCNLKYICQEIISRHQAYKLVWLIEPQSPISFTPFPACVKCVNLGSVEGYKELLSAKIIIQNAHLYQEYSYIPKKRGQIIIQTWHGALGIKRFDPAHDSVKSRVRAARRAGNMTDFFFSNSTFETQEVAPVFWKQSKIMEIGHARNDILVNNNFNKIQSIKQSLLIPEKTKIVLYAPTFRDDKTKNPYSINYDTLVEMLEKKFGGTWLVIVKFHYSNRKNANQIINGKNVLNVSNYNDIQELMLISDIGITDYSSWIFDFILTGKPAFLYAEDIANYEIERGFYYPLNTTPFSIATNNDELIANIISFDQKVYEKKVIDFLKEKGCVEKGIASKASTDLIGKLMVSS